MDKKTYKEKDKIIISDETGEFIETSLDSLIEKLEKDPKTRAYDKIRQLFDKKKN